MKTKAERLMDGQEMVDLCKKHTFFSWSAQNAVNPIPWSKAEGIYFWDTDGKRYTDLSSQLVSTNLGYGNQHVISAIQAQVENIAYAGPTMVTQIRAELGEMLAKYTPGDLNMFFFTLGGAEANENAIKLAFQYQKVKGYKRHKVLARWGSYHGNSITVLDVGGLKARRDYYTDLMVDHLHVSPCYTYRNAEGMSEEAYEDMLIQELENTLAAHPEIFCFLAEPIVGAALGADFLVGVAPVFLDSFHSATSSAVGASPAPFLDSL